MPSRTERRYSVEVAARLNIILRKIRGPVNGGTRTPQCRHSATAVLLQRARDAIAASAAPAPAVKTSLRSADRDFLMRRRSRFDAASAKASSSRMSLHFTKLAALAAMLHQPCLRRRNIRARAHPRRAERTRLVIALIFGARILKSDTRLADIPSGLMRRGFTAFAS
jgi:hypothetical protein